jgi:hypothetical protein
MNAEIEERKSEQIAELHDRVQQMIGMCQLSPVEQKGIKYLLKDSLTCHH